MFWYSYLLAYTNCMEKGGFFTKLYSSEKIPLELHFSIFVVPDKLALVSTHCVQNQSYANAETVNKGIFFADR